MCVLGKFPQMFQMSFGKCWSLDSHRKCEKLHHWYQTTTEWVPLSSLLHIRGERSSCVFWYSPSSSLISLNCSPCSTLNLSIINQRTSAKLSLGSKRREEEIYQSIWRIISCSRFQNKWSLCGWVFVLQLWWLLSPPEIMWAEIFLTLKSREEKKGRQLQGPQRCQKKLIVKSAWPCLRQLISVVKKKQMWPKDRSFAAEPGQQIKSWLFAHSHHIISYWDKKKKLLK